MTPGIYRTRHLPGILLKISNLGPAIRAPIPDSKAIFAIFRILIFFQNHEIFCFFVQKILFFYDKLTNTVFGVFGVSMQSRKQPLVV